MKNQSFLTRLKFAVCGIAGAFRREASFRTQALLGLAAAAALFFLKPPLIWTALCVLSAGVVLACELVNTSLEHLADRLHPEQHDSIRMAKDCAAGAVLIASGAALVIGSATVAVSLGWINRF
jgi:diacylglycerol kinase (ATP)